MKRKNKQPVTKYVGGRIRQTGTDAFMADFCVFGQRDRKRFRTIAEAKTFIDQKVIEVKNKGRGAFTIGDRDRLDIAEARKEIGDRPLSEIVKFWIAHQPTGDPKTVSDLIEEFLTAPGRRGKKIVTRRERTTESHRGRLRPFGQAFDNRLVHEVMQGDIEQWLDVHGWTGLNRKHYLVTVRALFNFALRKKYVKTNPAGEIELPDTETAEPTIMTVGDVEKYLKSIEATCSELLVREAIAFFCGLRPEELSRLDWKNISIENKLITVSGDVAKIQGHRRNVEMPDNLLAWLAPYGRDAGKIWPFVTHLTLHRKRVAARVDAGVTVPANAGRHAFASYHLALYANAPATAEAMGHADTKLLKGTYRNIVASDGRPITKRSGEAFFAIYPKREAAILQFKRTA